MERYLRNHDAISEEDIAKAITAVAERATAISDEEEGQGEAATREEQEDETDA